MNPFRIIENMYWRYIASPIKYARHIGVTIGENCHIATRNWSSEPYLIKIGNNVAITSGCYLHTHGGARAARRKYPNFDVFGKIEIKDWAYIGTGSQIMPGVTIGEGALITAGSIVTHSVPDNQVWGGIPAKYICTVDEYINRNIKFNLDSKKLSAKEKKEMLLSLPDDRFIRK